MAPRAEGKGARMVEMEESLLCLLAIYQLFGCKCTEVPEETKLHWEMLVKSMQGDWVKVCKYKLAAFFSSHTDQPMPQCPFPPGTKDRPDYLLGGAAGRWCHAYLHTNGSTTVKGLEFLTSILQSKKGMPRPGPEYLKKAVASTFDKLTTEKPDVKVTPQAALLEEWSNMAEMPESINTFVYKETAKEELRRTVRELFTGSEFTLEEKVRGFFPSTSANYIMHRSDMGTVGAIFDRKELMEGLRRKGGYMHVRQGKRDGEEEMSSSSSHDIPMYEVAEERPRGPLGTPGITLSMAFTTLWSRIMEIAKTEEPMVELVPLAEPLKVRVISKGPPFTYFAMRSLWKHVHSVLRQHPTFRLVGTPETEVEVLNGLGRNLRDDEELISGDYEDATNGMHSWVSETVAEEIANCLRLDQHEREIFIRSLTRHFIKLDGKTAKQVTGQLMGSITSFPILCIANAAMCRWALEVSYRRTWKLRDCSLLINGDDVAMKGIRRTNGFPSTYSIWQRVTAYIGLKESVGKTFISRQFVNINSRNYHYGESHKVIDPESKKERDCPYTSVPYVNFGLMKGLKRSQGGVGARDQDDPRNNLGTRATKLIQACPERMREDVMKMFINEHRELLANTRLPWYMPQWLGGIGLPRFAQFQPSKLDLQIGKQILLNWRKERPVHLGSSKGRWNTRKIAESYLPTEPAYTAVRDELGQRNYDKLLGELCINALFDSNVSMRELYQELEENNRVDKAIHHNARLWSVKEQTKKHGHLISELLELDELDYIALYPTCEVVSHLRRSEEEWDELKSSPMPGLFSDEETALTFDAWERPRFFTEEDARAAMESISHDWEVPNMFRTSQKRVRDVITIREIQQRRAKLRKLELD
jgi:uncharacterized protein (UPF0147 family)